MYCQKDITIYVCINYLMTFKMNKVMARLILKMLFKQYKIII